MYLDVIESVLVHSIRWSLPLQLEHNHTIIMAWSGGRKEGRGSAEYVHATVASRATKVVAVKKVTI
jgi:hypothetical protein